MKNIAGTMDDYVLSASYKTLFARLLPGSRDHPQCRKTHLLLVHFLHFMVQTPYSFMIQIHYVQACGSPLVSWCFRVPRMAANRRPPMSFERIPVILIRSRPRKRPSCRFGASQLPQYISCQKQRGPGQFVEQDPLRSQNASYWSP